MDVNWYAVETMAHQQLAELRAAAARCRHPRVEPRASPRPATPVLSRLGQRLLGALVAARAVAVRRPG